MFHKKTHEEIHADLVAEFEARLDALCLEHAIQTLLLFVDPKSPEEMVLRCGLIGSIERRYPAIAEWLLNFYQGPDDADCWKVEYPDAIVLAKEACGL